MNKLTLKDLIEIFKNFENGLIEEHIVESVLITYMSQDEQTIPNILRILERKNQQNKKLLIDTNLELSRALTGLMHFDGGKKADKDMRSFIIGEIKKHYLTWQTFIKCCFKIEGLP